MQENQQRTVIEPQSEYVPPYSVREEIANAISHGLGILFATVALTLMLASTIPTGDGTTIASVAIYGTTILLVFTASTLYHAIPFPDAKHALKIFDHIAIYLLISGTYTPFLVVKLQGDKASTMLVLVWTLAVLGVAFKIFFVTRFKAVSVLTYLAMGWLSLLVIGELNKVLDTAGMIMLGVGGLCYSVGVIFYINKRIPYNHAIWHLFVLAGAVCHFVSVFNFVLPDWWYTVPF